MASKKGIKTILYSNNYKLQNEMGLGENPILTDKDIKRINKHKYVYDVDVDASQGKVLINILYYDFIIIYKDNKDFRKNRILKALFSLDCFDKITFNKNGFKMYCKKNNSEQILEAGNLLTQDNKGYQIKML